MNKELINEILESIGLESIHVENEQRLLQEQLNYRIGLTE